MSWLIESFQSNSNISESVLLNEEDIYYNKDKFDTGEINLCFIIGHSGSGKSTMARNMSNNNTEYYELDDVIWNKENYTMDNFKKYGDLIYSFFKGLGKKYYYTGEELKNGLAKSIDNYEEHLIKDFIEYTKQYAKSHKNTKYVIEGIWIVLFTNPNEYDNYAFYIKGTSTLISRWRAAKRDSKDAPKGMHTIARMSNFLNLRFFKDALDFEKDLNKFRKYFSQKNK